MRKVASIGLFLVCLTLPIVVLALMGQPDSAGIWTLGTLETLIILLVFAGIWAMLQGITDVVRAFQLKRLGKLVAS